MTRLCIWLLDTDIDKSWWFVFAYNLYNEINIKKLLSRKAEVNVQNEHGMTPLHYACFWGYEQICEVSKEIDDQIL